MAGTQVPEAHPYRLRRHRTRVHFLCAHQAQRQTRGEREYNRYDLHVCTGRSCRKDGAKDRLRELEDLQPNRAYERAGFKHQEINVNSCGCLGQCGKGPSVGIEKMINASKHEDLIFNYINTTRKVVELLYTQCNLYNNCEKEYYIDKVMKSIKLRKDGNAAEDFTEAEKLYSEAIELNVQQGRHMLYNNRSSVRLKLKNYEGALEDAIICQHIAPSKTSSHYYKGLLREADVYSELGHHDKALNATILAHKMQPSLLRSVEYKALLAQRRRNVEQQSVNH